MGERLPWRKEFSRGTELRSNCDSESHPESSSSSVTTLGDASSSTETAVKIEPEARGRRPDKAMAKVRVVGFEGKNQDVDGEEDE